MSATTHIERRLTAAGYDLLVQGSLVAKVRPGTEGGFAVQHVGANATRTFADPVDADTLADRIARLHAA